MKVLMLKAWEAVKKSYWFVQEYILILLQWKLKVFKIQLRKWRRSGTRKELDKAYGRLGAEVFALQRAGQTDLREMPLVDQKLKRVEEAEAGLFAVHEEIETITRRYEEKKEMIRAKYRMKRSASGEGEAEDD
jgi:hypothetical protein